MKKLLSMFQVRPTAHTHTHTHRQGRTGGGKWPGSYCQTGPLNTQRVSHSMHRTYRPVSGLLGKIPIHLTLLWMITKKLHHIYFFFITFGSTNLPGWTHGIK